MKEKQAKASSELREADDRFLLHYSIMVSLPPPPQAKKWKKNKPTNAASLQDREFRNSKGVAEEEYRVGGWQRRRCRHATEARRRRNAGASKRKERRPSRDKKRRRRGIVQLDKTDSARKSMTWASTPNCKEM